MECGRIHFSVDTCFYFRDSMSFYRMAMISHSASVMTQKRMVAIGFGDEEAPEWRFDSERLA